MAYGESNGQTPDLNMIYRAQYLKTAGDSSNHQKEMALGESSGHVTDDVT